MLDTEFDDVLLFDILNAVELFMIVVSCLVYSTCAYIICETPLLHVNFMRLYRCLYIEFIIFELARIIKLVSLLMRIPGSNEIEVELSLTTLINTGFYGWLELIRYCGLGCGGYCMGVMLQERIVATIRLSTYEKWTNNGISWLFIISHIIGGVAGTIVVCLELIPFTIEVVTLLVAICLLIILFALPYYVENRVVKKLVFSAFNIALAVYLIIAPTIFLMSAHTWKRALITKFIQIKNLIRPPKITDNSQEHLVQLKHLKTLDGKPMVFQREDEQDLYFIQLKNAWNIT